MKIEVCNVIGGRSLDEGESGMMVMPFPKIGYNHGVVQDLKDMALIRMIKKPALKIIIQNPKKEQ